MLLPNVGSAYMYVKPFVCQFIELAHAFVTSISVLYCVCGREVLVLSFIKKHIFTIHMLQCSADEGAEGHSPGSHGGIQFRCSLAYM